MPQTINCNAHGDPNGALLHMIRTSEQRKAEIKDLEKHMNHLDNTGKEVNARFKIELDNLKDSLEYLTGNFVEIKIWSKKKINPSDSIKFNNMEFVVTNVLKCENHGGRFKNPQDKINTFYTVIATKIKLF
jgi:hypothetical protein